METETKQEIKQAKFKHSCIKCSKAYEDTDPDPYYCLECRKENEEIAKSVDQKIKNRQRDTKSELKSLEELAKQRGSYSESADGRNSRVFLNIKDVGINW